jgi:hypothetical protein
LGDQEEEVKDSVIHEHEAVLFRRSPELLNKSIEEVFSDYIRYYPELVEARNIMNLVKLISKCVVDMKVYGTLYVNVLTSKKALVRKDLDFEMSSEDESKIVD